MTRDYLADEAYDEAETIRKSCILKKQPLDPDAGEGVVDMRTLPERGD